MRKKIRLLLMFIFMISCLSGCWSRKELNELGIVTALGIDKTKEGYLVTAQIVNPGEIAGQARSGRSEVVRFMKSGETITEAVRRLSTDAPRKIYVAHLREVVFGEEIAREGIGKSLDVLSRHHEMRTDFHITVAKGSTAFNILNVQTAIEKIPATKLSNALENSEENWAATKKVTLEELIISIVSKGKEPVLTGIYVYGNPESGSSVKNAQNVSPETGLRIDQIGVFKKDKLQGWLNEEESKGFNYITDNVKSTAVVMPCEEGKITINTVRSKTKVKGKVESGIPKIEINVNSEGTINEVGCKIDLSKPEKIRELNEQYKENIKDKIEVSIKKVQEDYQSDIFGFGEAIYRADPKAWKRFEKNWDEEFSNLEVNVHVKANIRRLGTITESFQEEIGE